MPMNFCFPLSKLRRQLENFRKQDNFFRLHAFKSSKDRSKFVGSAMLVCIDVLATL